MRLFKHAFARLRTALAALALGTLALAAQAGTTDIYYHNDLAGTPLAATDAAGNVLWRQGYKPYGERLDPKAPAEQLPWYTGKAHVEAAGLSYFGARWYDPGLGRFMGVDPVGFSEANVHSFNRYAYANNNPYKFVDPDGRSPLMLLGRFFGGGAFGAGLGTVADAISQKAAFGSVDWAMAAQSSAARDGAIAGAMSFLPGDTPIGLGIKRVGDEAVSTGALAAREAQATSQVFSKDKQALVEMAKADKKSGITSSDMQAYKDLNKQLPDPFPANKVRGPEVHGTGAAHSREPHGHVGPVNHIPIRDLKP